jgi:hypothetical protein
VTTTRPTRRARGKADSPTTTEATTTAAGSVEDFCDQAFAVDAAVGAANSSAGEDGPERSAVDDVKAALATLQEVAPAGAKETAADVAKATEEQLSSPGLPSEAFLASFSDLLDWMADHCGYQVFDVTAHEYTFQDLPSAAQPGRTIVRLANHGNEVHEIVFAKAKDGVTESAEELVQLSEEESAEKLEFLSNGFAMPNGSGGALLDLSDGRYIAICFIPTGMTPSAMEEMMESGAVPQGAPHAMEGMVGEFLVG